MNEPGCSNGKANRKQSDTPTAEIQLLTSSSVADRIYDPCLLIEGRALNNRILLECCKQVRGKAVTVCQTQRYDYGFCVLPLPRDGGCVLAMECWLSNMMFFQNSCRCYTQTSNIRSVCSSTHGRGFEKMFEILPSSCTYVPVTYNTVLLPLCCRVTSHTVRQNRTLILYLETRTRTPLFLVGWGRWIGELCLYLMI
jgi:hypothetical protein